MVTKQNKYLKQFQKEKNRIQALIRRYNKKNILIDYKIKTPKQIRKENIQRLKKLNINEFVKRGKVYKVDIETGELFKFTAYDLEQSRKRKQKEDDSNELPNVDYTIIEQIREKLRGGENENVANYLYSIFEAQMRLHELNGDLQWYILDLNIKYTSLTYEIDKLHRASTAKVIEEHAFSILKLIKGNVTEEENKTITSLAEEDIAFIIKFKAARKKARGGFRM